MAKRLDGCFHMLSISLYENSTEERQDEIRALFKKTRVRFTNGLHVDLHHPPEDKYANFRCFNVSRNMVINHRGDFLACCQEIVPHFDLGSVHHASLEELWEAKEYLRKNLLRRGARLEHPYCAMCSHGAMKEYVEVVQQ
jgi:radical SAM protein with 4Fe4S-binding SPASM domain